MFDKLMNAVDLVGFLEEVRSYNLFKTRPKFQGKNERKKKCFNPWKGKKDLFGN
jgi:hypothetical protein